MFWVKVKSKEELADIVAALKELRYEDSMWSVSPQRAVAICNFSHQGERRYTILDKTMICDDPRLSWVANRQECADAVDFIMKVQNWEKEHA